MQPRSPGGHRFWPVLGAAFAALGAGSAGATPLRLDYCVEGLGGGLYRYTFTLVLDDNDQSWATGQGFGWIIFGDEPGPPQGSGLSPLTAFLGDQAVLPAGPFTRFESESGAHNGVALGPVVLPQPPGYLVNLWVPVRVGESISWRGTSAADLMQGELTWSSLATGGGAPIATWATATRLVGCGGQPWGACCLPDGACILATQTACSATAGVFRGDGTGCGAANCVQPATGACCLPDLSCTVASAGACSAQAGVYRGDGSACATAACSQPWAEQGDAGDLPATAQAVTGLGTLVGITGALEAGGADLYTIRICDGPNWSARTVGGATFDTQLFLFDTSGHGTAFDDDDPQGAGGALSRLSAQFIIGNGEYFLAIAAYDRDPLGQTTAGEIWADAPYNVERLPDGSGAPEAVGSWGGPGGPGGAYTIFLSGSCYVPPIAPCIPDCDHNHALNVNDFVCFQTAFAAAAPAADCNRDSTLNVNDFICFQQAFAAGCSAP